MKKKAHLRILFNFLLPFLLFTACQEEFEDIIINEEESFEVGSSTANLILNTSASDGSFDNIVDGASCFSVKFPYTVKVGETQILISSPDDFETVEQLLDQIESDVDILDFIFPITIMYPDFTELIVEDNVQLVQLASECVEGGDDSDIECIDFLYPITLFSFNIDQQQTNTTAINSDEEMRLFFTSRDEDELIGIDYPITLVKYDATQLVVNTNSELVSALEQAKDACDEDDDSDYNDDDFDEAGFVGYFTECSWLMQDIRRFGNDQTNDYEGFVFKFDALGFVTVTAPLGNIINGEWSYEFTEDGLILEQDFEGLDSFSGVWTVHGVDEETLKFFIDDQNRILFTRHCDDGTDDTDNDSDDTTINEETITNALKTCTWIINDFDDESHMPLLGYELAFGPDGLTVLSNGSSAVQGNYQVTTIDGALVLSMDFDPEPRLSVEWSLIEIDGESPSEIDWMSFENNDMTLELQQMCENPQDQELNEITAYLMQGVWIVDSFVNNEENTTQLYSEYGFAFTTLFQFELVFDQNPQTTGAWRIFRDTDRELKLLLNLGDTNDQLSELTEFWSIENANQQRIELSFDDGENVKRMILEKNM